VAIGNLKGDDSDRKRSLPALAMLLRGSTGWTRHSRPAGLRLRCPPFQDPSTVPTLAMSALKLRVWSWWRASRAIAIPTGAAREDWGNHEEDRLGDSARSG